MNFETASSLADFQQGLFERLRSGGEATPEDLKRLEENYWVKIAEYLAPGNLVIRHLCLIDLVKNETSYYKRILRQIRILSYTNLHLGRLWSEGYSYWLYVKPFIVKYYETFSSTRSTLISVVSEIDQNFYRTAYLRGSVLYPAPFGDLRDVPLEPAYQQPRQDVRFLACACLQKDGYSYYFQGLPIGLNAHIPYNSSKIRIVNGIPENFVFYTGYDKKYPTRSSEWKDILRVKRFTSLLKGY